MSDFGIGLIIVSFFGSLAILMSPFVWGFGLLINWIEKKKRLNKIASFAIFAISIYLFYMFFMNDDGLRAVGGIILAGIIGTLPALLAVFAGSRAVLNLFYSNESQPDPSDASNQ